MQKIPYGISDFSRLSAEDYYFVDRTDYIAHLETLGEPYLIYLRPRRFGKSLFISLLQHYYGVEFRDQFVDLFGPYHIGKNPTPLANSYLVLRFEFSRIDTTTEESTFKDFLNNVRSGVSDFLGKYQAFFPGLNKEEILRATAPNEMLLRLFDAHSLAQAPQIYLLIDEYDHFANELVSFNLGLFRNIVSKNGFVRKFYEAIKAATGEGIVDRLFVTGVTPLTMDSLTSGFNIGSNLSRNRLFQGMMGFREHEVKDLLRYIGIGEDKLATEMQRMKDWYNGYHFSSAPSDGGLYNPDMVLYYAKEFLSNGESPADMLDTNIASDYGKIRRLFSVGGKEEERLGVLERLLGDGEISTPMTAEFSFEKNFDTSDFLSLLYYMGMLTIKGIDLAEVRLGIPNAVIQQLYFRYFAQLIREHIEKPVQSIEVNAAVREMARQNNPRPLIEIVSDALQQLSNRDWIQFDEKHVKMVLISYLHSSQLYFIKSEFESGQKYIDVLLLRRDPFPAPYQFAFELKYLKQKDAHQLPQTISTGREQLQGYLQKEELSSLSDLKAWLMVFIGGEIAHLEEVST
ncbi:MAG: AAA family ATPase [Bacteroidetes bacterium]|nr:MAG: AAA family ATPase [Bacteroidota bacterium]